MKVTITIEDNTDSNEVTVTSTFSEDLISTTKSKAAWLGIKLIEQATELAGGDKKAPALPPRPPLLKIKL